MEGYPSRQPETAKNGRVSAFGGVGEPLQDCSKMHCEMKNCMLVSSIEKNMESTKILFSEGETETVHRTCFHFPVQGTNPPAKGGECAHCEGEPASGQNFILEIGI